MIDVGKQDDGVARIFARQQLGPVIETGQYRHIGGVVLQIVQHLLRVAHADRQLHAGMAGAVGRHHLDHMKRPHGADLEFALVELARVAQKNSVSASSTSSFCASVMSLWPAPVSVMR